MNINLPIITKEAYWKYKTGVKGNNKLSYKKCQEKLLRNILSGVSTIDKLFPNILNVGYGNLSIKLDICTNTIFEITNSTKEHSRCINKGIKQYIESILKENDDVVNLIRLERIKNITISLSLLSLCLIVSSIILFWGF